ncbi:MAG: hypothetical protein K8R53_01930 [Bacteroidales bacterium]|nr:hypothetical protein [Bacteroidales bacterium]
MTTASPVFGRPEATIVYAPPFSVLIPMEIGAGPKESSVAVQVTVSGVRQLKVSPPSGPSTVTSGGLLSPVKRPETPEKGVWLRAIKTGKHKIRINNCFIINILVYNEFVIFKSKICFSIYRLLKIQNTNNK